MWSYDKKLQFPVKIKNTNPQMAQFIISQYGGPHGELGASLRYLSQRYSMPFDVARGVLTDVGTEELGHLEIVGTIVHQLTRNLNPQQIKDQGFSQYYVDHQKAFSASRKRYAFFISNPAVTGDAIAGFKRGFGSRAEGACNI